jgi:pyrimidine and pyridine-specific 5'-nucleotidase
MNCKRAAELGWTTVHLVEEGIQPPPTPACQYQIKDLEELRTIFPQFFKSEST